jgi:hypothetical protein
MAEDTERAMGTHFLESADGGTGQNGKRNRPSDVHSLSEEHRWRRSDWQEKQTERRAITNWRARTEEQVRSAKETKREMGTHSLESADGGTSENGKRNRESDEKSLPREHRRRNK